MKVYTSTNFNGHYPVGVSAIVVADSIGLACVLLEQELKKAGLEQVVNREDMKELDLTTKGAIILNDGDY